MSKQAVFELTIEQELHDAFIAAAEATRQPPSQVLSEMMKDFILQQQMAPDYLTFLHGKAEVARQELTAGEGIPAEDVEQQFTARRAAAAARAR